MEIKIMEAADFGTPQLKNHFPMEIQGDGKRAFARVLNHPLDYYFAQKFISMKQYRAGCNLFNDYQNSHMSKNSFSLLGCDKIDFTQSDYENLHCSLERYMRIMKTLNKVSRTLAQKVCIEGYFVKQVLTGFSWAKNNSGLDRFKEALDDLSDFYENEYKNELTP